MAALVAIAVPAVRPEPVVAGDGAPKAVIIVGPSSGSTSKYLERGENIARSAERQGMDVRRIFHPRATWERVLANIQGANFVAYLGHGNGWPSPYAPFNPDSKNGFGLNPYAGASAYSTKYYGEDPIRRRIDLATNAVVLLQNLCYASGNGEPGMGIPSASVARQRVDNFASGFLDAGAGAVFAFGWQQDLDLVEALNTRNKTMDELFMIPGRDEWYTGYVGWNDIRAQSERVKGARVHLDPHPKYGFYRGVTGNLSMTTGDWRSEAAPVDDTAPQLTDVAVEGSPDASVRPADDGEHNEAAAFDPATSKLTINHTLSEAARVDVSVTNTDGGSVRRMNEWLERGPGTTVWDGRDDNGAEVSEGLYRVTLQARDEAGNVGQPVSVDVAALTSLRDLRGSGRGIHRVDGDGEASSVAFGATLTRAAQVTWKVIDSHGDTVRTGPSQQPSDPGDLSWGWNGRNGAGEVVAEGEYQARVSATTQAGTLTLSRGVFVGPYRLLTTDATPKRGQDRIRYSLITAERLVGTPKLTFKQPGKVAYTKRLVRVNETRWKVVVNIRSGGRSGTLKVSAVGVDRAGQTETRTWQYPLR